MKARNWTWPTLPPSGTCQSQSESRMTSTRMKSGPSTKTSRIPVVSSPSSTTERTTPTPLWSSTIWWGWSLLPRFTLSCKAEGLTLRIDNSTQCPRRGRMSMRMSMTSRSLSRNSFTSRSFFKIKTTSIWVSLPWKQHLFLGHEK